jgi:hypothetical protein
MLDVASASRNLVKSQTTWFRDDPTFRWLDAAAVDEAALTAHVLAELAKPPPPQGGSGGESAGEGGGGAGGGGAAGDSGRLSCEEQAALKRYVPRLRLFADEARLAALRAWVKARPLKAPGGAPASAAAAAGASGGGEARPG